MRGSEAAGRWTREDEIIMVQIAVLGHGTVGSGVVEVLRKNHGSITKKAHDEIHIKYILDLREFPDLPYADKFVKDFSAIENDPEVDIVVECMGGLHPAYDFVKACMLKGKHVVTSNKELVATKGAELLKIAREKNLSFLFEASVGGGIPIIRPLYQCLAANEVYEIAGILNGTTNFILTKMIREQMSFQDALDMAQKLGYAERDPSADVQGDDSCRKICILASLVFGKHVYPEQVHTEGITNITLEDVEYAESLDGVIKLLGRVKKLEDGHLSVMVCPAIVGRNGQLASVEDVFNGILVRGDAVGDVVFYGRGAGKLPTASAVVGDVIDCVKRLEYKKYLYWEDGEKGYVKDYRETSSRFYLRLKASDAQKVLDAAKVAFGEIQEAHRANAPSDEVAFATAEEIQESKLEQVLSQWEQGGTQVLGCIRLFDY